MTDREIRELASVLRRQSWVDDVDDETRMVLEIAYDCVRELRYTVRELRQRVARQAIHLERAEYEAERRGGL
jgi:signal transduction histidine kinase